MPDAGEERNWRYPFLQHIVPGGRLLPRIWRRLSPHSGDPPVNTALLLIAHGSRQADANADLHHLADSLRERGEAIVVASFLELAEPGIEEGGRLCVQAGANRVVLVPYFLSAGIHVRRDLTQARENLE